MTQQFNMINSGNFKKFSITEMYSMRHDKAGAQVKEAGKGQMVEDVYAILVDQWFPNWNAHTTADAQDNPLGGNMKLLFCFIFTPIIMQILNFTNISFRVTLAPSIGLNVKLSHVIYSKQSTPKEKWDSHNMEGQIVDHHSVIHFVFI